MPAVEPRKPRKAPKLNPDRQLLRRHGAAAVDQMPGLLRMPDVCALLNLERKAVRRLMREGGLRFARIGRDLRFRREWVDDFIDRDASTPRPRRRRQAR